MQLRTFMESELYGREYFEEYDEITDETVSQLKRLTAAAIEHYREDGVERRVGIEPWYSNTEELDACEALSNGSSSDWGLPSLYG